MSEDDKTSKTEDPTAKRQSDALNKGNVAKSQEINHLFNLTGGLIVFWLMAEGVMSLMKTDLIFYFAQADTIPLSETGARDVLVNVSWSVLNAIWQVILLLMVLAILAARVQHPFLWVPNKIKPDLPQLIKKFNLFEGLKNKFKLQALVDFGKSLAKFVILVPIVYFVVRPFFDDLYQVVTLDVYAFLELMRWVVTWIYIAVIPVVLLIAILDFWYQKKENFEKLKMTKQEVKDESKQAEGSPEIKAKIRQLRVQRARERMMQAVPYADVVVTNPTHFACALQYDGESMMAPRLLAKGVDELAFRIREVAEENDIPIVENPPLARAIYDTVDIDQEVKPEHYQAVAEVISFVMRTQGRLKSDDRRRQDGGLNESR